VANRLKLGSFAPVVTGTISRQEAQRLDDAAKEAMRTHHARLAELVALEARLIQPSAPRGGAAAASPLDPPGAAPADCGGLAGGASPDTLDPALLAMVMDEQKPLRLQASGRNESQDEVCSLCRRSGEAQ